jgi:hypothetical protein
MTHPLLVRRRTWPWVALIVLVIAAAAAWMGAWYFAAGVTQKTIDGWIAREAKAGRIYGCGSSPVGGFPFSIEVHCTPARMEWRSAEPTVFVEAASLIMTAQVWRPTLIESRFIGPLTLSDQAQKPQFIANWEHLDAAVEGGPVLPEGASIVLDKPTFERAGNPGQALFRAARAEVKGRIIEGSAVENPVISIALNLTDAIAPTINPLAAQAFNSEITFVLRGLKDFSPKPWPARFRQMQANGGRITISHARIAQGESVAIATGSLSLNDQGRLEGELLVTVAGIEHVIATFGLDKVRTQSEMGRIAGALDRISPGLGNLARDRAGSTLAAAIGLLGSRTQLEGKNAVVLPLRFKDGAMTLGAFPVGHVAPLF